MSFTDVLKKSFPFISAAASLGGPIGVMAASVVGKALNIDKVAPTTDGISNAIAVALADPTQRASLIQAEQQFQTQMTELGYKNAEDLAATDAADRANARSREVSLKDRLPSFLAVLITLGFFGVILFMLFRSVPQTAHDALLLLLGSLSTAWTAVVTYYYGSSAGSDRKTELLADGNGQK